MTLEDVLKLQEEVAELRGQVLDLTEENKTLKKENARLEEDLGGKEVEVADLEGDVDRLEEERASAYEKVEGEITLLKERLKLAGEIIDEVKPDPAQGTRLYDQMTDWIRGEIP